jgi:hypothetical protein
MSFRALVPLLLAGCSVCSFAQSDSSQCIVAGRLSEGAWAPRMTGVQLLDASGKAVASADKSQLSSVKQVRLASPALLSTCDGDAQLALGGDEVLTKKSVPAASAGTFTVEAVNYPRLRRGGELVELKVTVPAERVTMVTR